MVAVLSQGGLLLDLTSATAVKLLMKGTSVLVTGTMTKATVVTPTGTTASGSPTITSVSSFTNVINGGSISGTGIPSGARVGTFDSVAGTISLIDASGNAVNAQAAGSGVTLTINKGTVSYSWAGADLAVVDTYQVEFEITWTGGTQTVPNGAYNSIQVIADLENS